MILKKKFLLIFLFLLTLGLNACNGSDQEENEALMQTAESIAETRVAAQLTEIAEQNPTETPTPKPSPTPTEADSSPTPAPRGNSACLAASLSDENVPDDTVMSAGEPFEKTWVLTNVGACTWTEEYALVFHHGNGMGGTERTPLAGWVIPGQSVALSVNLVAPSAPGSHIGFWALQSPDGGIFGPSANGTFWVRITIPGPTPNSISRDLSYASGGAVRSDEFVSGDMIVGDNSANQGWLGFTTFNFGNLADDATVTAVWLELSEGMKSNGDPFASLGCLNVYVYYYGTIDGSDYDSAGGTPLWRFCSLAEMSGGTRFGSQEAIKAIQDALPGSRIQFAFEFDNQSDGDGVPDNITVFPLLSIYWYK